MAFYPELLEATATERARLLSAPVIGNALQGRISVTTYQAFLHEAYHHVKHTVPLLMACGARLPDRLEWLREAVAEYIEEETGHQEWILNDLANSGANPDETRHGKPGMATDIMVAFAWDTVLRRNPVGFFGMVLVLEGTSVKIATAAAQQIQATLKLPAKAFSYLSSHGSLDQSHMVFFESLINRLDDRSDQLAVLDTARVMYQLYGNLFRSLSAEAEQAAA